MGVATYCLGHKNEKSATTGIIEPETHLLMTTNSVCKCVSNVTNTKFSHLQPLGNFTTGKLIVYHDRHSIIPDYHLKCKIHTNAKSATSGIMESAGDLLATTNSVCECVSNTTNTKNA